MSQLPPDPASMAREVIRLRSEVKRLEEVARKYDKLRTKARAIGRWTDTWIPKRTCPIPSELSRHLTQLRKIAE